MSSIFFIFKHTNILTFIIISSLTFSQINTQQLCSSCLNACCDAYYTCAASTSQCAYYAGYQSSSLSNTNTSTNATTTNTNNTATNTTTITGTNTTTTSSNTGTNTTTTTNTTNSNNNSTGSTTGTSSKNTQSTSISCSACSLGCCDNYRQCALSNTQCVYYSGMTDPTLSNAANSDQEEEATTSNCNVDLCKYGCCVNDTCGTYNACVIANATKSNTNYAGNGSIVVPIGNPIIGSIGSEVEIAVILLLCLGILIAVAFYMSVIYIFVYYNKDDTKNIKKLNLSTQNTLNPNNENQRNIRLRSSSTFMEKPTIAHSKSMNSTRVPIEYKDITAINEQYMIDNTNNLSDINNISAVKSKHLSNKKLGKINELIGTDVQNTKNSNIDDQDDIVNYNGPVVKIHHVEDPANDVDCTDYPVDDGNQENIDDSCIQLSKRNQKSSRIKSNSINNHNENGVYSQRSKADPQGIPNSSSRPRPNHNATPFESQNPDFPLNQNATSTILFKPFLPSIGVADDDNNDDESKGNRYSNEYPSSSVNQDYYPNDENKKHETRYRADSNSETSNGQQEYYEDDNNRDL